MSDTTPRPDDTGHNYKLAEAQRPTDPLSEIAELIRDGKTDAATVRELIAMHTFVENRRAEKDFAQALHACQRELKAVAKDAANPQTKSQYATLEAINRAAMPAVSRHGFSLSYGTDDALVPGEVRIVLTVRHVGGHQEQYRLDLPRDGIGAKGNPIGQMNPVQAVGSTFSYGRRYLVMMFLNLTIGGEDDDGNAAGAGVIDGKQTEAINRLLEQCDRAGYAIKDMPKFLEWAINCGPAKNGDAPLSLAEVPAKRFPDVVNYLTRRLAEGPTKPTKGSGK